MLNVGTRVRIKEGVIYGGEDIGQILNSRGENNYIIQEVLSGGRYMISNNDGWAIVKEYEVEGVRM
jgi:hypothetical protein